MSAVSSNQKIHLGIIGAGFAVNVHLPAFRLHPNCEVVAICSGHAARSQEIASKRLIPVTFKDWREMLASPRVNAVTIAVPPHLQPEILSAAIHSGKHVFCEKPVGGGPKAADELARVAAASGLVHMIDFEFMELPAWQKLTELLKTGALGKINRVQLRWQTKNRKPVSATPPSAWKNLPAEGGGYLNLLGSHALYYLEALFGPIAELRANLLDNEFYVELNLNFVSGLSAELIVDNRASAHDTHTLSMFSGSNETRLENNTSDYMRGFELNWMAAGARQVYNQQIPTEFSDGRIWPVSALAGRFLAAIEKLQGESHNAQSANCEDTSPRPNLVDGARVEKLIHLARVSVAKKAWVKT